MWRARFFILLSAVVLEWIQCCWGMTVTIPYDFNTTVDVTPDNNSTADIASTPSALTSENTTISMADVNVSKPEMVSNTSGIFTTLMSGNTKLAMTDINVTKPEMVSNTSDVFSTESALMPENTTIAMADDNSTKLTAKPKMNTDTSGGYIELSTYMETKSSTRQVHTISYEYSSRKTATKQMTDKSTMLKGITTPGMVKPVTMEMTSKMMEHTTMKTMVTDSGSNDAMQHKDSTATIIVSVVLVVLFIVVAAIIVICILRRKRRKSSMRMPAMMAPIAQPPNVQLDFENLNDASTPGEFLLDKSMIDLESPTPENEAVEAVTLLENAVEDFGSREITTFHPNKEIETNEVHSAEARNSVNKTDTADGPRIISDKSNGMQEPDSANPDGENNEDKNASLQNNPDPANADEENKNDKTLPVGSKSPSPGETDKSDSENLPLSGNGADDPTEHIPLSAPTPDTDNPNPSSPQEKPRVSMVTEI